MSVLIFFIFPQSSVLLESVGWHLWARSVLQDFFLFAPPHKWVVWLFLWQLHMAEVHKNLAWAVECHH